MNTQPIQDLSHQLTLLSNAFRAAEITLKKFTFSRFPQNKGTKSNPLRFKDIAKRAGLNIKQNKN